MSCKRVKLNEGTSTDVSEANERECRENHEGQQSENSDLRKTFEVFFELSYWEKVWRMEQNLSAELMTIDFKSDKNIAAIYNPLDYAENVHTNFMRKFLKKSPTVLFLGMNPGPYGMCQTSIPFGHVPSVKNWMKIDGIVEKPLCEVAAKPIEGFDCKREEQSGKRFWGVLEELCVDPEVFFKHSFVYNICPLAFLTSTGRNITPPEIKGESKSQLHSVVLKHLKLAIEIFHPQIIISVGGYANDRIKELKKKKLISESIDCKLIPHPSPRSLNNQNWVEKAKKWYNDNDIVKFFEK